MPKRFDPTIEQAIVEYAINNPDWSDAEIRYALEGDSRFADKERLPTRRTIANRRRAARGRDKSGPWRLGSLDEPADEALVTETIRELTKARGARVTVTQKEAERLVQVRKARPDMDPRTAYALAVRYVAKGEGSTEWLDLQVALWGDNEAWRAAFPAVGGGAGWLEKPPTWRLITPGDEGWEAVRDLPPGAQGPVPTIEEGEPEPPATEEPPEPRPLRRSRAAERRLSRGKKGRRAPEKEDDGGKTR